MRRNLHLFARPFAAYSTAIVLASVCWLNATDVFAESASSGRGLPPLPEQHTPAAQKSTPVVKHRAQPNRSLGHADEMATLHAIHVALTSVGDGGAYLWRRRNGLLRALIQPTASFKSSSGNVCRHVVVRLMSGKHTRQTEGVACRNQQGAWSLSG